MLCSPHNGPFMGQTADFMTCCPSLKRIGRCAAVLPQGGEGDGTGAVIRNREILNAHQRMNAGFITSNAADCLNLRHAAPYSMAGSCSMQGWREDASRIGCPWAAVRFPLRDRIGTADAPQVVGRCPASVSTGVNPHSVCNATLIQGPCRDHPKQQGRDQRARQNSLALVAARSHTIRSRIGNVPVDIGVLEIPEPFCFAQSSDPEGWPSLPSLGRMALWRDSADPDGGAIWPWALR